MPRDNDFVALGMDRKPPVGGDGYFYRDCLFKYGGRVGGICMGASYNINGSTCASNLTLLLLLNYYGSIIFYKLLLSV